MSLSDFPRYPLMFGPSRGRSPGTPPCYAHLGGQPALNAYSALFR